MTNKRKVKGLPGSGSNSRRILGGTLVIFFFLLALPFVALLKRVYSQLEAQTYFQYRTQAEELTARIERRISELVQPEELRPFAEYQFFSVENAPLTQTAEIGYSALSQLPVKSNIPGIIGYFQVNPGNRFTTPLLPDASAEEIERLAKAQGISTFDLQERLRIRDTMRNILSAKLHLSPQNSGSANALGKKTEEARKKYASAVQGVFASGGAASTADRFRATAEMLDGKESESKPAEPEKQAPVAEKTKARDSAFAGIAKGGQTQQLSELKLDTKYWEGQQQLPKPAAEAKDIIQNAVTAKLQARQSRKEIVTVPSDAAAEADSENLDKTSQSQRVASNKAASFLNQLNITRGTEGNAAKGKVVADAPAVPQGVFREQNPAPPSRRKIEEEEIEVQTFEGAIDPFQFELFPPHTFAFYRKVWRNNQRLIQGFVANSQDFLNKVVREQFYQDSLSGTASLIVGYKGEVHATYPRSPSYSSLYRSAPSTSNDADSVLLYRSALPPPLEQLELLFTSGPIAVGPEVMVVHVLAATFALILLAGLYAIYALGVRQLDLIQQRSDFVSAVSHELKTPLTSIRMYAEMLREGWVDDLQKQKTYYDFIFFETERLSRLITNVLQFSRLSKRGVAVELKNLEVSRLLDVVRSKVDSQVQASGFSVTFSIEGDAERKVSADEDSFVQIFTNLVDNAIKFSGQAERKEILVGCRALADKDTFFFVRDFGPGIDSRQMKKIFDLFYRGENEMTRTTPGTGIGLALVRALAETMHGEVTLENMKPGAEFTIRFPRAVASAMPNR